MNTITVTLEDQGVPADIARHRRSVESSDYCAAKVSVERYDPKKGRRAWMLVPCQNLAIAMTEDGQSFCATHRTL